MLTKKELNNHNLPVTPEIDSNMDILLARVNKIQVLCGIRFVATSGLRDLARQMQINPKATNSKHLYGQAVDIFDPDKKIQAWVLKHVETLEEIGLWCEAFQATPNWIHFQSQPPRSGHRFFAP